jgi:pimeloyl-ACP methyl ester carboxylesterase
MPVAANIYYFLSKSGGGGSLPVVLIHGAGGTHLHWPSEIRRMPDLRIFALDLPGHGKSGRGGLQSVEAYADSIYAWMEVIKLHRAVFVGHSMGGAVALTLAGKYAEHVLALGLLSTGARLRVHPFILENVANPQSFPTAVSFLLSKSFSKNADPRLVELASKRMREIRPSVLSGDFLACDTFDMMGSISSIKAPTVVFCGEEDELTPLRYAQYLNDHILGSELVVIPEAGHMVMLEKPKMTAEALREFLSQIRFHPGRI